MSVPSSPTVRWISATLLLVAAVLAAALPFLAGSFVALLVGAAAVTAGLAQLLRLTAPDDLRGKVLRALSGLLYLAGGFWCLLYPIDSVISFTLFVGFLMVFEGITELAVAAARPLPARGLVLLDGIVTAVLGGLLIAGWPADSLWAVGSLFAITLAFTALNLILASPQNRPNPG
ncbi:MAG: DUF308 domain-containing protein [Cyanobacteriota bacterium]|nr:DUF308 domain-containing protein [Cyanobacteriota bacterium]